MQLAKEKKIFYPSIPPPLCFLSRNYLNIHWKSGKIHLIFWRIGLFFCLTSYPVWLSSCLRGTWPISWNGWLLPFQTPWPELGMTLGQYPFRPSPESSPLWEDAVWFRTSRNISLVNEVGFLCPSAWTSLELSNLSQLPYISTMSKYQIKV